MDIIVDVAQSEGVLGEVQSLFIYKLLLAEPNSIHQITLSGTATFPRQPEGMSKCKTYTVLKLS